MRRLAVLLFLAGGAVRADPGDLASRIDAAMDVENLHALRAEVEEIAKARPRAPETVDLLRKLARAYWLWSDGDEDEELILRIAEIPGVDLDVHDCRTLGGKSLRERRYADAREWFARGLARIDADDGAPAAADLRAAMGEALEGLGRWEEALGYHESWRPQTFCGNCAAAENTRRRVAVARCQYRVGLVDEALGALWKLSSAPDELLWSGDPVAFAHFAELSVREGRIEELKEQHGTLPEKLREEYARILVVAEAFAARDAATIVRTVCNHPDDFSAYGVVACCGRMLDDCRPGSVAALAEALKGGGWEAVELAGHTRLKELLPSLKAQLAGKPPAESAKWLRWAIPRLEAVP